MGAFNELIVGEHGRAFHIQFKFGSCRQYLYKIGEHIVFDVGQLGQNERYLIPGIAQIADAWQHFAISFYEGVIENYSRISEEEYDQLQKATAHIRA